VQEEGESLSDETSRRGLSAAEAERRLAAEGYNDLPRQKKRGPLRIAVEVMREPMLLLLVAGGLVYLALGDRTEALMLLAFANFSILVTIVQESRTERVLRALRDLASPRALVIRDGVRRRIPGREVARGDLVVLAEGDRVPADCVIVEGHDLAADESLLTGEAVPVAKRPDPSGRAPAGARPGGDGQPIAYSGALMVRGTGLGLVFATGPATEIGRIGGSLSTLKDEPPRLQVEMRRVVRFFGVIALGVSGAAVVLHGAAGGDWLAATLQGVAVGMALLPEEFPVVLTVFLAMGAWRISKARVLTRRAAAIESLGAASVLCTDKTGTLTENRMQVEKVLSRAEIIDGARDDERARAAIAKIGVMASARTPVDPMEKAFHALADALAGGAAGAAGDAALVHAFGLRPDLLAVANVWRAPLAAALTVAAKGAPEAIAELSRLDGAVRAKVLAAVQEMAAAGMRVIGVARGEWRGEGPPASLRAVEFEFLGLVGLADPLRASARAAVAECRAAGVRVVMVTGDFPATAAAIAKEAGIDGGRVVTGDDLSRLDDAALARRVGEADVFARIMPEQKLRLVNALKAQGEIVAMTGDGVNDAPALKAAHIGVAMGGRGSDVAREASSIVLLDDDFSAIVKAIRLGRTIYDNLGKAAAFIIAVHVPIAALAIAPLLTGTPILLGPVHIALLEMVIDPVCALVFEAETAEKNVMRRPPRSPDKTLVSVPLALFSFMQGAVASLLIAGAIIYVSTQGASEAVVRTTAFMALLAAIAALVLVNRSFSFSIIRAIARPNRPMAVIFPLVALAAVLAVTIEPVRALLRFAAIGPGEAAVAGLTGLATLIALEGLKLAGAPEGGREKGPKA
jgi:Ca2+-transporting ATPase